jgi:hypothetical protein
MTSFLLGVHASITLLAAFLNLTGWNLLSVSHHSLNLVPEEFQGTRDSAWRRLALQQQSQRQPTRALVHIDKPFAATHPESVLLKVKCPVHPACADVPVSVDTVNYFVLRITSSSLQTFVTKTAWLTMQSGCLLAPRALHVSWLSLPNIRAYPQSRET